MILFLALISLVANASNPCFVFLSPTTKGTWSELTALRDGSYVGRLRYVMRTKRRADIQGIFVKEKRTGVSIELIRNLIDREPGIQEVEGMLILDNYAASGLGYVKRHVTFEECEAAVHRTPFYKSFFRFGYTRVIECQHARFYDYISVALGKEWA